MADAGELSVRLNMETDEMDSGIKNILSTLSSFAGKAAIAGVAAVGAFAGKALQSANEYSKSLEKMQIQTGLSSKETEMFGDSITDIYEMNYADTISEAGDALSLVQKETKKLGNVSKTHIEAATADALLFSKSFEQDLNPSVKAATALSQNFGMDIDDSFNMMAAGFQKNLNYSDDFLDTIIEYSPNFKDLGLTATDVFTYFQNGAESGVYELDKIGDGLREAQINLSDFGTSSVIFEELGMDSKLMTNEFLKGGEDAKAAFGEVMTALSNVEDPIKRNQLETMIFGSIGEDAGEALVSTFTSVGEKFTYSGEEMQKIDQLTFDNVGSKITSLGKQFETGVLIPIGQKILPVLNDFLGWVQEKVPLIQTGFEKYSAFMSGIWSPVFSNVFGIVKGELDKYNWKSKDIVNSVKGLWEAAKKYIKVYGDHVQSVFSFITQTIIPPLVKAIYKITPVVINMVTSGINNMTKMYNNFRTIFNTLRTVISTTISNIKTIFSGGMNTIKSIGKTVLSILKGDFRGAFNGIKSTISTVMNTAKSLIRNSLNAMNSIFGDKLNSVKSKVKSVYNSIKSILGNIASSAYNWGRNLMTQFISGITAKIGALTSKISSVANTVKNFIGWSSPTKKGAGKYSHKWIPNLFKMLIFGVKKYTPKLATSLNPVSKIAENSLQSDITGNIKTRIIDTISKVKEARKIVDDFRKSYADNLSKSITQSIAEKEGLSGAELTNLARYSGMSKEQYLKSLQPGNANNGNMYLNIEIDGDTIANKVMPIVTSQMKLQGV